tara:strand:+ start:65 stop:256 length:192 start_codon:yes stop_codon:yes gene_type:complete
MDLSKNKTLTWQDKRLDAINRAVYRRILPHWYVIEEYINVLNSKAKNKKQYKGENNAKTILRK